jgi:hypothetical protein
LISFAQFCSTASGVTTRWGPGKPAAWSDAMNDRVCSVFPSPISSARMPPVPPLYCEMIQLTPSTWYGRSSALMKVSRGPIGGAVPTPLFVVDATPPRRSCLSRAAGTKGLRQRNSRSKKACDAAFICSCADTTRAWRSSASLASWGSDTAGASPASQCGHTQSLPAPFRPAQHSAWYLRGQLAQAFRSPSTSLPPRHASHHSRLMCGAFERSRCIRRRYISKDLAELATGGCAGDQVDRAPRRAFNP